MHIHTCTDGCIVSIKAAGPQPSCFCHCSSSCLFAEVDILKRCEAKQGSWNPLASVLDRKFSPNPGTEVSVRQVQLMYCAGICLCATGAVTY